MRLLVLPEGRMQRKPGMLEISAFGARQISREQPGIPAKATHHLFIRRVGSPGYGEGSSQGQKGAALAVCGMWLNPV